MLSDSLLPCPFPLRLFHRLSPLMPPRLQRLRDDTLDVGDDNMFPFTYSIDVRPTYVGVNRCIAIPYLLNPSPSTSPTNSRTGNRARSRPDIRPELTIHILLSVCANAVLLMSSRSANPNEASDSVLLRHVDVALCERGGCGSVGGYFDSFCCFVWKSMHLSYAVGSLLLCSTLSC